MDQVEATDQAEVVNDEIFAGRLPIGQALEKLRLRLLDLTARNRLLNFKHSAKTLQFVDGEPTAIFERLVESNGRVALTGTPEPKSTDFVRQQGRLERPSAADHAKNLGLRTSFDLSQAGAGTALRALFYGDDLERQCRRIGREARTAIEETGANMLFLLLGFLEFPEAPQAAKTFLAPLACVPVSLDRGELDRSSGTYRYSLSYTGEELNENLSLREKLKADLNLELPDFTEETSLETYYRGVSEAIKGRPGFKFRSQATLALVSMTKMLLVRDLDPKNWPREGPRSALTQHPIVRSVFEGTRETDGGRHSGEEYEIDRHELRDLPLIFDADSSQHSALIDVAAGKNLVIEGPPGTGKSQTITNLISSAICQGKKVLFVAEKLAALQVVQSRLSAAGLSDFCLELHSNKTSKKDVLDSIGHRLEKRYPKPSQLDAMIESLGKKRQELNIYVELLNKELGNNQGLTVHQILWKAELYRQKTESVWRMAVDVKLLEAPSQTAAEFESLYTQAVRVGKEYSRIGSFGPDAPFWGFFPRSVAPSTPGEVDAILRRAAESLCALSECERELGQLLESASFGISREDSRDLRGALARLASAHAGEMADELLPKLFGPSKTYLQDTQRVLRRLKNCQEEANELHAKIDGRLNQGLDPKSTVEISTRFFDAFCELGLTHMGPAQLGELSALCKQRVAAAKDAVASLGRIAHEARLPFDGRPESVIRIAFLVRLAADCPRELLHLRTPELGMPGSAARIKESQNRFTALAREKQTLSQVFYLDMSIPEGDVERAVTVLRQGIEWWRILQREHRAALALHKRISKNKAVRREERRSQLEDLHAHLRALRETAQDVRYSAAMGAQWRAQDTEFEAVHKLALWLENARAVLGELGINETEFDPIAAPPQIFATLAKFSAPAAKAEASLKSCYELFDDGGRLSGSGRYRQRFLECDDWAQRATVLQGIVDVLGDGASAYFQLFNGAQQPVGQTHQAAVALARLAELTQNTLADAQARDLFGDRFVGLYTDLLPIDRAIGYGSAVCDLDLPEPIHRTLLSEKGARPREALLGALEALERAWVPVDQAFDLLTTYGEFDLHEWAGCDASSRSFITNVAERVERAMAAGDGQLLQWAQYVDASDVARQCELRPFVELLESGQVPADLMADLFAYRFYGSIAEKVFENQKRLARFSGHSHEAIREEFRRLDTEIIRLRGKEVAAEAAKTAKPPGGTPGARVADKSEMALIEYLLPQSRPRVPIRKLMIAAGRAIQELKPCFMMGPQAVAQFLAPGKVKFDIVVMDEASQLKPEEALGAIARGSQLVVVGDPKQLPPTAFFDKFGETSDDEDSSQQIALMQESILDVCMGHFRPVRTLRWHYRSQHESLIAFSNARFYGGKLIVFPSAFGRSASLGTRCHYVAGATYENQVNLAEANVVVEAVLKHMRERPDESLGVVTLNLKQRELIEELLDRRIRDTEEAESFCVKHDKAGHGFFVKNLENVQGDERDVIFVSTTFGPAPKTNVVYQRFGPISRHDGWRRLNVLFTRARKALAVFTSMKPEDIVDGEKVPRGTRELRRYLEYLRTSVVPDDRETDSEPESDFEVAVMDALGRAGYECKPQHGVAGFRIDIAVRHPGHKNAFLAAIECDGAAYHSGRSARDRDRIRQSILESLGWKGRIFRIWSTDWYRSPTSELSRLLQWLDELKTAPFDAAYISDAAEALTDETARASGESPVVADQVATLDELGVRLGDDVLEVQVGDRVTYRVLATGDEREVTIGITTDESKEVIGYATPLAETLMGLQRGEMGLMQQPGRSPVNLRVMRIVRT